MSLILLYPEIDEVDRADDWRVRRKFCLLNNSAACKSLVGDILLF
jgi:hypothetical protein